jgi:hypothetical protein
VITDVFLNLIITDINHRHATAAIFNVAGLLHFSEQIQADSVSLLCKPVYIENCWHASLGAPVGTASTPRAARRRPLLSQGAGDTRGVRLNDH